MKDSPVFVREDQPDILEDIDGIRVCAIYGDTMGQRKAICERMALCWNACLGKSNEELRP